LSSPTLNFPPPGMVLEYNLFPCHFFLPPPSAFFFSPLLMVETPPQLPPPAHCIPGRVQFFFTWLMVQFAFRMFKGAFRESFSSILELVPIHGFFPLPSAIGCSFFKHLRFVNGCVSFWCLPPVLQIVLFNSSRFPFQIFLQCAPPWPMLDSTPLEANPCLFPSLLRCPLFGCESDTHLHTPCCRLPLF